MIGSVLPGNGSSINVHSYPHLNLQWFGNSIELGKLWSSPGLTSTGESEMDKYQLLPSRNLQSSGGSSNTECDSQEHLVEVCRKDPWKMTESNTQQKRIFRKELFSKLECNSHERSDVQFRWSMCPIMWRMDLKGVKLQAIEPVMSLGE